MISTKIKTIFTKTSYFNIIKSQVTQKRSGSYYSSPFLEDIGERKVKYEVTNLSEDWKFVERLLPPTVVPEPIKKAHYPSGWKPQSDNLGNEPYFIARTKNHMIPVYMSIKNNGTKRLTFVKHIQGDIWKLEKDILNFLQPQQQRPLRSQVNEFAAYICLHGDHVNAIKYWLEQKSF